MTFWQSLKASLIRLARILVAQIVAYGITETAGIEIPYINISVGAALNALAKFLRDKFNWNWLPV